LPRARGIGWGKREEESRKGGKVDKKKKKGRKEKLSEEF
jgi:hypothetical protein